MCEDRLIRIHARLAQEFGFPTTLLDKEGLKRITSLEVMGMGRYPHAAPFDPVGQAVSLGARILECRPFLRGNELTAYAATEYMLLVYGLAMSEKYSTYTFLHCTPETVSQFIEGVRESVKAAAYEGPLFEYEMTSYVIARQRAAPYAELLWHL